MNSTNSFIIWANDQVGEGSEVIAQELNKYFTNCPVKKCSAYKTILF